MVVFALATASAVFSDELQRPEAGKKIKVFVLAGQSNMEGRADGRKLTGENQARLRKVQGRVQLAFNREPVRPLDVVAPSEEIRKIYQRDRIFGPELFFGISLAEAWPDEKFLFIKLAEGGTSLHGCWHPEWSEEKAALMEEAESPKLYGELVDYVRKVLEGYSTQDFELCAMLWVQGESDGKVPEAAAAYGTTLRTLVERVRSDLGNEEFPFLLFQVGSLQVAQGMKECAAEVANVSLLLQSQDADSPDFYQKMNNGHYNYAGMKKLGNRFAEEFLGNYAARP